MLIISHSDSFCCDQLSGKFVSEWTAVLIVMEGTESVLSSKVKLH